MELFCRITGNGPPVIILHGLLGMSDNWHSQAVELAKDHTVYVPDMRNHGQSPHDSQFSYQVMVDDLADMMDQHEIVNPLIIGHSMGGKIGMLMALRFPDLVKRIIVVDIHPGSYTASHAIMELVQTMIKLDISACRTYAEAEKYLSSHLADITQVQLVLKNMRRGNDGHFIWKPDIISIYNNLERMIEPVGTGMSSDVPALFIRGSLSSYITPADHTAILMKFPAAAIITIEGAGHWVHADRPAEFMQAVKQFC